MSPAPSSDSAAATPEGWLADPQRLRELLKRKSQFLFDLDGTLVDSSSVHARAYRETLEVRFPALAASFDYEVMKGKRTVEVFRELGLTDPATLVEMVASKQQRYLTLVAAGEVLAYEGAQLLLARVVQARGRCFLATGASRRSTLKVLELAHLGIFFTDIVTADEVTRGKPDPECFQSLVTKWQLPLAETVVVEDAASGVAAARAAGLDVLVVRGTIPGAWPVGRIDDLRALIESRG